MLFSFLGYFSYLLLLPGILLGAWAQVKVKSTFSKYSKVPAASGKTATEISEELLKRNGCYGVALARTSGNLTDNYNPKTEVLSLSDSVANSSSVAAIGVAAHEVGHAVQHSDGYIPLVLRSIFVPIVNIGTYAAIPLVIIGVIIEYLATDPTIGETVISIGILAYSLATIFALITIPVELNASRRALNMLTDTGYFSDKELKGARKVLSAAALTYVAAAFIAFLYLLRFILIVSQFRKRK